MQKRLSEIDYMRAISILSVIMIHVSGAYVGISKYAYITNQIVRYAVPVFIILSGFSLFYTDLYRSNDGYFSFINRRFKKIVIPYIIWSFVYIFFYSNKNNEILSTEIIIRKLIHGLSSYHLYFIIIILQLYLVYPLIRKYFHKYSRIIMIASFLLTLYYQSAIYLNAAGFSILPLKELYFANYSIMFTWIFYFVLGMYIAMNLEKLKRITTYKVPLIIAWLISFSIVYLDSKITNTFELSIKPSIMLYSIISFALFYSVFIEINSKMLKLGSFLNWISTQSFLMYFGHVMILREIIDRITMYKVPFIMERWLGMLVLYVIACLITFILTFVISNIPYSYILGAKTEKRFYRNQH